MTDFPRTPTPEDFAAASEASAATDMLTTLAASVFDGVIIVGISSCDSGLSMHLKARFGNNVEEGSSAERMLWRFMELAQASIREHMATVFGGQKTVITDRSQAPLGAERPKAKA